MNVYVSLSLYLSLSIYIHIYIYIYMYTHIHLYTHTHTYTYRLAPLLVPLLALRLAGGRLRLVKKSDRSAYYFKVVIVEVVIVELGKHWSLISQNEL